MNEELKNIRAAFDDDDDDAIERELNAAVERGDDAMEIIGVLTEALEEVGNKFSKGEFFLPDLVMAGERMEIAMNILKPVLLNNPDFKPTGLTIVFGSVKGDIHDIGKNMVKMMWVSAGYEVVDLGVDVDPEAFLNKAVECQPDVVALSSTMTNTIPSMKDTIDLLSSRPWKKEFKILVGGGSLNPEIADMLGAFAYGGKDAYAAVQVVRGIFNC